MVNTDLEPSAQLKLDLAHMMNTKTANFAFVFEFRKANYDVALWVHQSQLAAHGDQFKRLHRLPTPTLLRFIAADRVQEYSLEAYCALVHFLYTGNLEATVDLFKFIITDWPISSPAKYPQNNDIVNELRVKSMKKASCLEISKLAKLYGLDELCVLCAAHDPPSRNTSSL
ncbi:hypothetical protein BG006_001297 [Podila minutissima]|uniref:BTB domain-containing protein n=1 Tax=Podila minutissima TaxID=64525 RepID=A0A9P5ST85_9FUNG|nr:hypothetical protein BG006_001297 [Podila minutissima]